MRVSAIQIRPTVDRNSNLEKAGRLLDQAANQGSSVAVLPEFFSLPFVGPTPVDIDYFKYAETIEGQSNRLVADKSREYGMTIVSSVFEESDVAGVYYNSACTFQNGELLSVHRKTHLPFSNNFPEKFYFRPGSKLPSVVNIGDTKLGTIICYERHFPELSRAVACQGATVLCVPVAVSSQYMRGIFKRELAAHAIFNTFYVVCANRIGKEGRKDYFGASAIYNPDGEIIASSQDTGGDEVVTGDVNVDAVTELRQNRPFLRDLREEIVQS